MADKQKSLGHTVLGWFVVPGDGDVDAEGRSSSGASRQNAASRAPQKGPASDAAVDDLIARYANAPPPPPVNHSVPQRPPVSASPGRPPPSSQGPGPGKAGSPPGAPADARTMVGASAGAGSSVITQEVPVIATGSGPARPGAPLDFPDIFKRQGLSAEQQGHVERALMLLHNLPKETPNEIKRQIVEASLLAFGFPIDKIIESAALHLRALDRYTDKGQKETQILLEESNQRLKELEAEAARVRQVMQEQLAGQQSLSTTCGQHKVKVQEILDFFGKEAVERVRASSVKLRDG